MTSRRTKSICALIHCFSVSALIAFGPGQGSGHEIRTLQEDDQPNLIYIMADDLGYGDLGCFGQTQIQTPNLDRMADEGMRLTSYYASATVCRPSRLSLWTGRHTGHTAIDSNQGYILQPNDLTVAELISERGYATGGVGKWALGGVGTTGHPNQNGFDYWMGYLNQSAAHNYFPTHLWSNEERVPLEGNRVGDFPNGRGRVSIDRVTFSHDVMTEAMLAFIRENHTRPFLAHVHWTLPHANNEGGRVYGNGMEIPDYGQYDDTDWPDTAKGQAAMVSRLDLDVGRILSLLDELEIAHKTLVIFTSDNGPHSEGGHRHEFFDANGPLRGFKRDLYEGGIRVPTIAWWPGTVEAGTESDVALAGYDWLPTACELTGAELPPNIDGRSFASTLMGNPEPIHEHLYWSYENKRAVRLGEWKGVSLDNGETIELYDLSADIGETRDVAAWNPEFVQQIKTIMTSEGQRPSR